MSGQGEHAGRGSWNHTGPFSVPYALVGFCSGVISAFQQVGRTIALIPILH